MRIAELADRVGVPTSTVRSDERVGLLATPSRTAPRCAVLAASTLLMAPTIEVWSRYEAAPS